MKTITSLAALALFVAMVCLVPMRVSAVVREGSVTPASVKAKETPLSVKAEKGKDGLIHFTITYHIPDSPKYVGTHFELRDGQTLLARTDTASVVHEDSATFYVVVSPKYLADSKFNVSSNWVDKAGGLPAPDGAIFDIDLQAFGKNAPAAKGD